MSEIKDQKPEIETEVLMSICNVCKGSIKVAVKHMLNEKRLSTFYKEAAKEKSEIKIVTLNEFRLKFAENTCTCND